MPQVELFWGFDSKYLSPPVVGLVPRRVVRDVYDFICDNDCPFRFHQFYQLVGKLLRRVAPPIQFGHDKLAYGGLAHGVRHACGRHFKALCGLGYCLGPDRLAFHDCKV